MNQTQPNTSIAPPPVQEWLTLRDACAEVGFGPKMLRREVKLGRLRAARIGGRGDLRFHRSWLHAWLERAAAPVEVTP